MPSVGWIPQPHKKLGPIEQYFPIFVIETTELGARYVPAPISELCILYGSMRLTNVSIFDPYNDDVKYDQWIFLFLKSFSSGINLEKSEKKTFWMNLINFLPIKSECLQNLNQHCKSHFCYLSLRLKS